jgi:hypothetical protein
MTTHIVTQVVKEIVANAGVSSRLVLVFRRELEAPSTRSDQP